MEINPWQNIFLLITCGLLVWFLFRTIKKSPGIFKLEHLHQSMLTMGILALILIAFISICIMAIHAYS